METESYTNNSHLGRKIERIRRLRGMTQTDLGELLGVTKQAISKMEQSEKIDDDKLKHTRQEEYKSYFSQHHISRSRRISYQLHAIAETYSCESCR